MPTSITPVPMVLATCKPKNKKAMKLKNAADELVDVLAIERGDEDTMQQTHRLLSETVRGTYKTFEMAGRQHQLLGIPFLQLLHQQLPFLRAKHDLLSMKIEQVEEFSFTGHPLGE